MISRYIQRTLEQVVKRAVNEFPAIVLTGPRQSGKTTLLKHLFSQSHKYVSLESRMFGLLQPLTRGPSWR